MRTDSPWAWIRISRWARITVISLGLGLGWYGLACTDREDRSIEASNSLMRIADVAAFDHLLDTATERLLVVDFFADWCAPCKLVDPILEKVAKEAADVADFYAVDVDANRQLAQRMGVSGIPNVLLIRNGKTIERLRGVLPKETYLTAIRNATR